ncbi:hypothetical protein NDK43_19710 [Neobacillus pocheonensis]|uniref:Uncharacterized protein n=1 Tax=Neobacillus pocheonensis TaxID=363869 RepID=A0ABT0WCY8_9BACI|nr:hypothetical protein [Neobacillus pocheonensis]
MKVLSTLWGLIVDDGRLASILLFFLIISWSLSMAGQPFIGAIMIWAGLLISLWVSINHQLQLKISKKK